MTNSITQTIKQAETLLASATQRVSDAVKAGANHYNEDHSAVCCISLVGNALENVGFNVDKVGISERLDTLIMQTARETKEAAEFLIKGLESKVAETAENFFLDSCGKVFSSFGSGGEATILWMGMPTRRTR